MSEKTPGPRPLVIIGAGRSGTNMLRDVLCRMPGLGTWPCDEINYIWRHGNRAHPDDEFPGGFARPKVQASPIADLRARSLVEVCGLQWRPSVERAMEDLNRLPRQRGLPLLSRLEADPRFGARGYASPEPDVE